MTTQTISTLHTESEAQDSWVPMVAIAFGQVLMSFNVASLPVAIGGMVATFNVPPTTVATGIVMYSLAVAGLVMLGAKLCQRFGALRVFRAVVLIFGAAMVLMTFSPTATVMIAAQGLAGAAGAALVPSLVALIADNYKGRQQATALGALGSARAGAGVAAFLIGGILGTFIGWRPAFGILIVLAGIVFWLSFRLKGEAARPDVQIDVVGVVLAAVAILLISLGFNNLNGWGLGLARPGAPFDILGLSPAPVMIVIGIVLGQAFLRWTHRRQASGKTPLLALDVIDSPEERAAVYAMFTIVALEAALNFTVPLYIQIVQGRSPLDTAIAMMPFNLSVFFAAMLIVRMYDKMPPRQIGRLAFAVSAVALIWLAFVVRNNWSTLPVLIGLVVFGVAQGSLVTLLFNVLVTASPKELAARHDQQPGRGGRHGGCRRARRRAAQRQRDALCRGESHHPAGVEDAGRSRQHQFRQQRPAARDHAAYDRDTPAGDRGDAHQRGCATARAQDRAPHHGGRGLAGADTGGAAASVPAGRIASRTTRDAGAKRNTIALRSSGGIADCKNHVPDRFL